MLINKLKWLFIRFFSTPEKAYRKNGMKIGNDCDIKTWDLYPEAYLIEIGNHVQITAGCRIFTHGGSFVLRAKYPDFDAFGKVIIGDNIYMGNNVMIMPGITIGNNVVIGAGSIVTKNVPDNVIIGGNPARVLNTFDKYEEKMQKYNMHCYGLNSSEKKKIIINSSYKYIKIDKSI